MTTTSQLPSSPIASAVNEGQEEYNPLFFYWGRRVCEVYYRDKKIKAAVHCELEDNAFCFYAHRPPEAKGKLLQQPSCLIAIRTPDTLKSKSSFDQRSSRLGRWLSTAKTNTSRRFESVSKSFRAMMGRPVSRSDTVEFELDRLTLTECAEAEWLSIIRTLAPKANTESFIERPKERPETPPWRKYPEPDMGGLRKLAKIMEEGPSRLKARRRRYAMLASSACSSPVKSDQMREPFTERKALSNINGVERTACPPSSKSQQAAIKKLECGTATCSTA
eukprot:TRINITY_DN12613_c1_g1_i8.p1 TRINITY_DN12613_c1_g1~~TRINITY_DN12613_c1_g1_i8.p1  ORF type:complete len:277 (+),score=37.63 TRINITY_DN12613_c1_g1_i8:430-1260(+)